MPRSWWETRGIRRIHPSSADNERVTSRIIIDITYECNLRCANCNNACGTAPSEERMTVDQIKKFVDASIHLGHRWQSILLEGGEPTLHPDLFLILDELMRYRNKWAGCVIGLTTNGHGPKVHGVLKDIEKTYSRIWIRNTGKNASPVTYHEAYHAAPCDMGIEGYEVGCSMPYRCGLALTPYGYFPCSQAATIARVFNIDMGKPSLIEILDDPLGALKQACRYCGRIHAMQWPETIISPTWERALEIWKEIGTQIPKY